jgi:2-keto-4-pentenoate hydratase/2-oxohepta-3-ene-1,7-dioic acid hydratase in catechol pathway
MKLLTFQVQTPVGQVQRIGALWQAVQWPEPWIVDLNAVYAWLLQEREQRPQPRRWADFLFSAEMRAFLGLGDPALQAARWTLDELDRLNPSQPAELLGLEAQRLIYAQSEVRLKTPVPNPRMLRDFLSFETHTANGFKKRNEPIPEPWYRLPVYYKGNPNTLLGADEPLHWPSYTNKLDYELELACIIGREGKNIPVEEAAQYIAGYAIMNDFSARDIQRDEMMCRLGPAKGKDFATVVGPWLVTPDEVSDIRNLRMTAKINGELWSDGNSGTSHWTFEQMIAHVSKEETLYPGDILGSGTVGFGCGLELDRWLQPNDLVELEIQDLGILRNRVVKS